MSALSAELTILSYGFFDFSYNEQLSKEMVHCESLTFKTFFHLEIVENVLFCTIEVNQCQL